MAYSKKQWEKARYLFEIEKPLSAIESETGISKGQISKRSKKEGWEKGNGKKALIEEEAHTLLKEDEVKRKKETIKRKKETLTKQERYLHDEIVDDTLENLRRTKGVAIGFQSIIEAKQNATLKLIEKVDEFLESELLKAETEDDIQKLYDAYNSKLEMIMSFDDIKKGAEANDKLGQTLGVVDRFSTKQEVNVQNNNISNSNTIVDIDNASPKEITNAYLDMIKQK